MPKKASFTTFYFVYPNTKMIKKNPENIKKRNKLQIRFVREEWNRELSDKFVNSTLHSSLTAKLQTTSFKTNIFSLKISESIKSYFFIELLPSV